MKQSEPIANMNLSISICGVNRFSRRLLMEFEHSPRYSSPSVCACVRGIVLLCFLFYSLALSLCFDCVSAILESRLLFRN